MSRKRPLNRDVIRAALRDAHDAVGPVERLAPGLDGWGYQLDGAAHHVGTFNATHNARARAVAACVLASLGFCPDRSARLLAGAVGHPEEMARAVIRCADA